MILKIIISCSPVNTLCVSHVFVTDRTCIEHELLSLVFSHSDGDAGERVEHLL